MALDPVLRVAHDCFPESGKPHGLDRHAGLLAHFAPYRLVQGLADFDDATRKAVKPLCRRAGTPHHQDLAVPYDCGADSKKRPLGIDSGIGPRCWIRNWLHLSLDSSEV